MTKIFSIIDLNRESNLHNDFKDKFKFTESEENNKYSCTYCGKLFKHRQSKYNHEKKFCVGFWRFVNYKNNAR